MEKTILKVNGLMCENCVKAVKKALLKIGINQEDVNIDLSLKKAEISHSNEISVETIVNTIEDLGYKCEI